MSNERGLAVEGIESRPLGWALVGIWLTITIVGITTSAMNARRIFYMGRLQAMTEEGKRTQQLLKDLGFKW